MQSHEVTMQSRIYELQDLPRNLDFPLPLNEVGWMPRHRSPVQTLTKNFVCISFNWRKYSQDAPAEATFSVHYPGTTLGTPGFLHDEVFFSYSRECEQRLRDLFKGASFFRAPFIYAPEIAAQCISVHERLGRLHEPGMADNLDLLALQLATACVQAVRDYTAPADGDDMRIHEIAARLKQGDHLDELIPMHHFSRRAFYYAWNRVFQISPNKFRQDEMLKQVESLLRRTSMSVSEIAFNCGFNNEACLYRLFKQKYHLTPTQYRRRQQSLVSGRG